MRASFFICLSILITVSISYSCNKEEIANTNEWQTPSINVNGELMDIHSVKTLKIWGNNNDQGFAYGYLLGPEIIDLMNTCVTDLGISANDWELALQENLKKFYIPEEYSDEIDGILSGMKARNNNKDVYVSGLGRSLTKNDLSALNCDLMRISCSSFSGWGSLTSDGSTITGRNMDYANLTSFIESQIIVVRIPSEQSDKKAWISFSWPGDIGCTTGMNEDGLTVSQQDVNLTMPQGLTGMTPDNLIHRLIIEHAEVDNIARDIEDILSENYSILACAPLISWPYSGEGIAAIVPEFDGDTLNNQGFDIRYPEPECVNIIGTNHFRTRVFDQDNYWRYDLICDSLSHTVNDPGSYLDVPRAKEILSLTPIPELLCMHSVIFEPNKGELHFSFASVLSAATELEFTTLSLDELFDITTK